MVVELKSVADVLRLGVDEVIDVRAPAEYAEDHLPGAINLPVLSDDERAEVGTIYKQVSPFDARKVGAALVARNAAAHLQGPLADRPGSWRPMVYCWRGGQRSGSFASILSQIGWRVELLRGGYKSWRGLVVDAVYHQPVPSPVIVLDGNTGSAKTDVLKAMAAEGIQVIDLEGLANHRGSLFGAMGPQPSQKAFENRLALALAGLDPSRPVVVEAESSKVGDCRLPPRLWKAMTEAPRIAISAPRDVRAGYLTRAYADMIENAERLDNILSLLRHAHSAEQIASWREMARTERYAELADGLMQEHYDPRYAKHRARMNVPVTEIAANDLSETGIRTLAQTLCRVVEGAAH